MNRIIVMYIDTFPNLQYQKGLCDACGLDVKYKESYFKRMFRWLMMGDTLYQVQPKKRGSQTS